MSPTISAIGTERSLVVSRTARYIEAGDLDAEPSELWLVMHGYGQLARDFIQPFKAVVKPGRLIAAPEALSRFYETPATTESHRSSRVGASWMTREDRLNEIADYIAYLDLLEGRLAGGRSPLYRVALGFSQGAATAARWAVAGATAPDHLILWGGLLPPDVELSLLASRLPDGITWVIGGDDRLVSVSQAEHQAEEARVAGLATQVLSFNGGHRLDRRVLLRLGDRLSRPGPSHGMV
ncbi:MAG TPA: hypothetical protein VFL95_09200 [Gemmatimonadales bacterium]|nr:hypothetical protein [Gemmatimonadales bacterium]